MANADTRFGLRPVRHLNGNPWNGQGMKCYVPSTDSTAAYFIGDPVVLAGSADATATCPTVTRATAGDGNKIFGVIVGFEPDETYDTVYRADDTSRYCYVCCDPDVIFEVQACSGAALGATSVGLNAVIIFTHSGSTVTGYSGCEMDSGTTTAPAANGSYQLLILGAVDRPDNDISVVNAKWEVLISLHSLRAVDANADGAAEGAKGV